MGNLYGFEQLKVLSLIILPFIQIHNILSSGPSMMSDERITALKHTFITFYQRLQVCE